MRVAWHWPYLRPEHLPLVDAMADLVDELVVHTIAGRIDPSDYERGTARIDPNVPDVGVHRERSLAWLRSRTSTYVNRVRHRHDRASDVDLMHVMFVNRFTDWWALERLARRGALVTSVHDAVPHQSRMPESIERLLLRRLYAGAGEIVVHHASVGAQLRSEFGVAAARIHDVDHWVLPAASEHRARPNRPPTVLCFGALRRNKGIDVLLDAIAARPEFQARFVFAGRGAPELEARLSAAATSDRRITAEIGYVSETRKDALYRDADLVVLPYTSFASQSGVLHDAYAHGRPVVVTDVGALGSSVRADGTGRVVPANDPSALIDATINLLADEEEWRLAANASEAIRLARHPTETARRLLAIYEHARRSTLSVER